MLTKYFLHIGEEDYELSDEDLRNWDDIQCSYKRDGYEGVVRSFSSQFEFVNRAKEILTELYLKDRFNAQASISIWTMNDRWEYEKRFECPLDFSTIEIEDFGLRLNSIDNSLAALIKANKSTKYEFVVGTDIRPDNTFYFDRLPMHESVTYEFTQGTSEKETGEITVNFRKDELPFVGVVNDEVTVNGAVYWQDDQTTDTNSYLLKAVRDVTITLDYEMAYRSNIGGTQTGLYIRIRRNGSYLPIGSGTYGSIGLVGKRDDVVELSGGSLPDPMTNVGKYAIYNGYVFKATYNPSNPSGSYYWENTGQTEAEFFISTKSGKVTLNLQTGDFLVMTHEINNSEYEVATVKFIRTRFNFAWIGRGETIPINVFTPAKVARAILNKIADDSVNVLTSFSNFDNRLAKTYIMAAESVRGIAGAKFYSSFDEFCDWMSAVFGYVFYIGEVTQSRFKYQHTCGQYSLTAIPYDENDSFPEFNINQDYITYVPQHARFFYHEPGSNKLYPYWAGWEAYNDPVTKRPRTDTLYKITQLSSSNLYYFEEYNGGNLYPQLYEYSDLDVNRYEQTIHFVHRSELYNRSSDVKKIDTIRDLKYSVDTGVIYSSVTIGYEKKDYDNVNGRDEFNFNNTYTTGCTVSDKTLSLLSKYRADCYGIEFAAQKRGKDTTDSESDQTVFFVGCTTSNGVLVPDRSIKIEDSISDQVFNGAYCPMACLKANAGYIGLMADILEMKFASSTGNSDIVIDGISMSADITLKTPFATNGVIDFLTSDVDEIADLNDLIEIENDGVVYRGFLKEVDVKYAKTEAANYKLIVKDIVL